MAAIFNKLTFEWNAVDDIAEFDVGSPQEWLVDPVFPSPEEQERCMALGPKYWVFSKEGSPEVDTIRSLTDEEINTHPTFVYEALVAKITELSYAAQGNIVNGFQSDAIGETRIYDSQVEDQLNLVGAFASVMPSAGSPEGGTMYYSSRDIATLTKTYLPHSYAELRQVLDDGAAFKLAILVQFNTLKAQVMALTTISDIQAVTWTPVTQ